MTHQLATTVSWNPHHRRERKQNAHFDIYAIKFYFYPFYNPWNLFINTYNFIHHKREFIYKLKEILPNFILTIFSLYTLYSLIWVLVLNRTKTLELGFAWVYHHSLSIFLLKQWPRTVRNWSFKKIEESDCSIYLQSSAKEKKIRRRSKLLYNSYSWSTLITLICIFIAYLARQFP